MQNGRFTQMLMRHTAGSRAISYRIIHTLPIVLAETVMDATVAERGQVVIPKAMRDQLGITPGMQLSFSVEDGKLVIRKKVDDAISRVRGVLKLAPGEDTDQWFRETRGRAPSDLIEPWEELRDDPDVPAAIRVDHERRRAMWLKAQAAEKAVSVKSTAQRASKAAKTEATTTR
jgi:antitoxin PrlF